MQKNLRLMDVLTIAQVIIRLRRYRKGRCTVFTLTIMKTVLKKLDEFLFLCLAGVRCRKEEQLELDTKCKKKLSMRTTAENEKAHSPGHSLCSECGK